MPLDLRDLYIYELVDDKMEMVNYSIFWVKKLGNTWKSRYLQGKHSKFLRYICRANTLLLNEQT